MNYAAYICISRGAKALPEGAFAQNAKTRHLGAKKKASGFFPSMLQRVMGSNFSLVGVSWEP